VKKRVAVLVFIFVFISCGFASVADDSFESLQREYNQLVEEMNQLNSMIDSMDKEIRKLQRELSDLDISSDKYSEVQEKISDLRNMERHLIIEGTDLRDRMDWLDRDI